MKRRTIISSFLGVLLTGGGLLMGAKRRRGAGGAKCGTTDDARRGAGARGYAGAVAVLGVAVLGVAVAEPVGALTYSRPVEVEFTFEPMLTVALSSADLVINNLAPGNSSDSNVITITTTTNNSNGSVLSASVGNTTYNTKNLVQTGVTDNFASLEGNASESTLSTPNTWGYALSTNSGSTWSNYSGLPLYDSTDVTNAKELVPATGAAGVSTADFKIAAYAGIAQAGGEYKNVINFVAVAEPAPEAKTLYSTIAEMSKGKQTAADLQAAITVPTTDSYSTDTSNSGVYEYDADVFGEASDASNANPIYYYRGVLEDSVGSYGSDGSAVTYPNYVVLSSASEKAGIATTDTCWRIVRTTGSGGVKMIYNGKWTGSTCANTQGNAQVTTSQFNATSAADARRIVRVGYTYNADYDSTADTTPASTLLGSNASYAGNDDNSIIKGYIENTWFSTIGSYESMLEPSAGYCNDRTIYNTSNVLQPENVDIVKPYGTATSGYTQYNFGARTRNFTTAQSPSLTCATYNDGTTSVDRSVVDLYTTNKASNGNGQLAKPAALLTADEMSFAGSGSSTATNGSAYHANSFLRSGSTFWLLSPSYRLSNGRAYEFSLRSSGTLNGSSVGNSNGVRPAISLTSGTAAVSGAGTATEPWIVNPGS